MIIGERKPISKYATTPFLGLSNNFCLVTTLTRSTAGLLLAASDKFLHPPLKISPFQKYSAIASAAFDPNVSA